MKTTLSEKILRKSRKPEKVLVYESLFTLNQEFEQILDTLEQLGRLGLFQARLPRKFIRACRVTIEETRAWANFELTYILHAVEETDWSRLGGLRGRLEHPNSVLSEPERNKRKPKRNA